MAYTMTRTEQRKRWTPDVRIELLESDADRGDANFAELERKLGKIMAVCVSILVALVTSSVLLALNLAIGAPG